jgi:hypothetical protein
MSHKITTQAPTTLTDLDGIVKALQLMMQDPHHEPLKDHNAWTQTATSVRIHAGGINPARRGSTYYYLGYEQTGSGELQRVVDSMYTGDRTIREFEARLVQYYQAVGIVEALAIQGIQCEIRPQVGVIEIFPKLSVAALGAIQSRI